MSDSPAIQIAEVSFRRGRVEVLRDVSLAVAENQVALVVGGNGAGKTSLLRILAGLERVESGRVMVAGYNLATRPVEVRRATSFVPELPAFESELTAAEQLTLHARLAGLGPAETRSTVSSMLELLDLNDLRNRLPGSFSRGQRHRLAIGRALVRDPAILLFDEPLLGLDEGGQAEFAAVLEELRALGKTMVFTSRAPAGLHVLADATYSLAAGALAPLAIDSPTTALKLVVLGDGERARELLARLPEVVEARLDEGPPEGPTRLHVQLRAVDPPTVARLVRSIVESGAEVVEVYSEPAEVA